jgi:hypothetical protein
MAMTRIQLPPSTKLSIAQFGDVFRSQGFIIEQLTDDRLQAQAPRSIYSDIFPFERWFPAARIIIERSADGYTMSHRPPVRRLAIASFANGLLVFAIVPGAMATRFWLAAATAGLTAILQLRGVRRQRTLLAIESKVGGDSDASS